MAALPTQALRVASVVEGHGEVEALPVLLRRLWVELLGRTYVDVCRPIRENRSSLLSNPLALRNAVELAGLKLAFPPQPQPVDVSMILVLIDADDECPADLGPRLLADAVTAVASPEGLARPSVSCVVANVEYETWFAGGAEGMPDLLPLTTPPPLDPEGQRCKKKWVQMRYAGSTSYSETVDQPRLTARMNLVDCRARCPSFEKLCRELESL